MCDLRLTTLDGASDATLFEASCTETLPAASGRKSQRFGFKSTCKQMCPIANVKGESVKASL